MMLSECTVVWFFLGERYIVCYKTTLSRLGSRHVMTLARSVSEVGCTVRKKDNSSLVNRMGLMVHSVRHGWEA